VLLLGVGIQLMVLAGMIFMKLAVLVSGQSVLLRVQPVDPRDLLRGDYVILGYAFSQISSRQVEGLPSGSEEKQGRVVYAVLEKEPGGEHWGAVRLTVERPTSGVFLTGRVGRWGRVEYGIESFFVQEGKGRVYEDAVRTGHLSAVVVVSPEGQAVVKELVIGR
jgi:uncharacterized membrane-anchored protein